MGTIAALAVLFAWQLGFAALGAAGVVRIAGALGVILPWGHLLMALTVLLLVRRWGAGVRALGFRPVSLVRGFWLYAQALVLGYFAVILWGAVVYTLTGQAPQENILPAFGSGRAALAGAAVSASLVAPVAEEIVFRGLLFTGLRQRFGTGLAIFASGLAFALIHFNPLAFPALLALGAILAWLFQRSGSLWVPVALHATVNSVTLLVWYAQTNGLLPVTT